MIRTKANTIFWKTFISAVGVAFIIIAVVNLLLFFLGDSTTANVHVRQVGEADYSKPEDKRFEWSLDYTFLDKNGVMYSGHSLRSGSDDFVNSDNRVYYFPFAPNISSLESEAEPKLYQPIFLVIGIFLIYVVNIGRPKALAE